MTSLLKLWAWVMLAINWPFATGLSVAANVFSARSIQRAATRTMEARSLLRRQVNHPALGESLRPW